MCFVYGRDIIVVHVNIGSSAEPTKIKENETNKLAPSDAILIDSINNAEGSP